MRKQLFTYLFFILTIICFGQRDRSQMATNTATLEVIVKLKENINTIKLPPDCGILEVNSLTLTYNVVKVIQGGYKSKTILINHRCPKQLVNNKLIANDTTYTYKLQQKTILPNNKTKANEIEYEVIE